MAVMKQVMKRWRAAIVFAIVLIVSVACAVTQAPTPTTPVSPQGNSQHQSSPPIAAPRSVQVPGKTPPPKVDAERLFRHIQALNFERYRDLDRSRTRAYLLQTLTHLGWQPQLQRFEGGINVVAQRAGTDPKAGTILVAAHFDTVKGSPGADDNASSIATALEIARLLGQSQTPRALQVALFDAEETGLLGSFAFTANAANLVNLAGVVNLEMLGYACRTAGCQKYPAGLPITPPTDRGDFLGVIGDQEHLPLLDAFVPSSSADDSVHLPPVVTLPIPFKGVLTPDVLRSDHAPFWARNIGAVMIGDTANFRNPHYHQPSDTPETLDRTFLTGSAQRVINAVTQLLNSHDPLTTIDSTTATSS
jgi:hypothetical protein